MDKPKNGKRVLSVPGRSEARAIGLLLQGGAGVVALSLLLPHPGGGHAGILVGVAAAMLAVGLLCFAFAGRVPIAAGRGLLFAAAAATGLLIWSSGVAAGQYGTIFVWATLIAAYYFPARVAFAQVAWILAIYAVVLGAVESTAGYSPFTRWAFTAVSLSVVALMMTGLVSRRQRADQRARRFFDLSRDMLCTFDREGKAVELNSSWQESLGYSEQELRDLPSFAFVHPDERERTELAVMSLFEGARGGGFENRYRARDGSWHWLSWSAALAEDEGLIYARATDVTELKRVTAEREELLTEVEGLAMSDALTGLANRRALDEHLQREMSRARRSRAPICVAMLDLDRFKSYNDEFGHLAGDQLLQDCARAWDGCLRGADLLARFGGEEFVVVLPDTDVEGASIILERLREATPGGTTCSGGLASWDFVESREGLLERADVALYRAKASGRDQLVSSS